MIRFTKEERLILLFLLAALFIGTGISYYKKLNPASSQIIEFDREEIENPKKVNINKATKEELVSLRNVGPVLAERIIAYREKHGPFKKKEDIKNVKGIGDKTFELIKEWLISE